MPSCKVFLVCMPSLVVDGFESKKMHCSTPISGSVHVVDSI